MPQVLSCVKGEDNSASEDLEKSLAPSNHSCNCAINTPLVLQMRDLGPREDDEPTVCILLLETDSETEVGWLEKVYWKVLSELTPGGGGG